MPKSSPIQNSFNSGEISPRMGARVDLTERYAKGCNVLENFIPTVQGPINKRPGTRFVNEAKIQTSKTRLVPFEFNVEQAYMLELGNQYMRVYRNNGIILSGVNPYEVATPWLEADLDGLQFAQSADVLYVAHQDYSPRTISRLGHTNWSINQISFVNPPIAQENLDPNNTIRADRTTGLIGLVSNSGIFSSENSAFNIGAKIKLREIVGDNHQQWFPGVACNLNQTVTFGGNVYKCVSPNGTMGERPPTHTTYNQVVNDGSLNFQYIHSGECILQITQFDTVNRVLASIISNTQVPQSVIDNPTSRWSWGAWDSYRGYPKCVTFFEDRLLFAGGRSSPQTIWGSKTGDYVNFETGSNAEDSYQYTLNTDQVNAIQWLNPGKLLIVGTVGGEFIMSASSIEEGITPTNVRVVRVDTRGSKEDLKAIPVGAKVLFVQRSGKKIRELQYVWSNDEYQSPDLTVISDHITSSGLKYGAHQQEPDHLVWYTREDGKLICMTYERAENVVGWHRHILGGPSPDVESIAVIPHPDGDQDQVWMVVKYLYGTTVKRHIVYLEKNWDRDNNVSSAFYVDSGLSYNGNPITTINGLGHLEGQTVSILADGGSHPDKVVQGGSLTLDRPSSAVHIGFGYTSTMQTMNFEAGAADGTAQGKTKRITNVTCRLDQTGAGLWVGPDENNMEEINFRSSAMNMDEVVPLFDGDVGTIMWPGGYDTKARVMVQHRLPLPCTLLAVMPQLVTQDR